MKILKSFSLMLLAASLSAGAQKVPAEWNTPGAGNPLLPGYFADPTIKKFGDTYYIYATTDGTGNGYGPAQVWMSKDFVNWRNVTMNWPTTEVVWAPDVVQQPDGTYRYYYCTPCVIYVGESDQPTGPWKNRLGAPDAVLVEDRFVHNAITLDPQLFVDDDGSEYLYFGTWGIYENFGCGVAKLAPDGKSFTDKKLILNTEIKDFFEAPFVFKKDGIYYFTYSSGSCHDHTYRVQYAISKEGPMGPYEYKGCILETNADGTIHGPGHHSVLIDGDDYYIVYHRHNNPHSIHGFHRQICIDKMEFDADGNIRKVVPTHDGLIPQSFVKQAKKNHIDNLAFGAKVTASSYYDEWFKPEYATDDNNATLWRARNCHGNEWITIDLGENKKFNQVWTQFEYTTFFYQYKIETSVDGANWTLYADKTKNTQQGSPMIDQGECKARYIRITVTDTQKNGHFPAIWNVKVYQATKRKNPMALLPEVKIDEEALLAGYPWIHQKDVETEEHQKTGEKGNCIIDINAADYATGKPVSLAEIKNRPGGSFKGDKKVVVEVKKGKYAFYFNGQQSLRSNFSLPKTMTYNAPYTLVAWTLNPEVGNIETVAEFTERRNDLATIEFRQGRDRSNGLVAHNASFENSGAPKECVSGEGEWQHWVVTFDGYNERVYLNGKQIIEKNMFLMIRPEGNITLGASMDGGNKFSGYLHSLQFYDKSFTESDVQAAYAAPSDTKDVMKFDGELAVSARILSPNLVSLAVVDAEGQQVESGLLSYKYAVVPSGTAVASVDWSRVKASNTSSLILSTDGQAAQTCLVQVSDDSGNFRRTLSVDIQVSANLFTHFGDQAGQVRDYVKDKGQWDGIIANPSPDCQIAARADNGVITLASANTNLNNRSDDNGVILYKEVTGDFLMQAKVTAVDGQEKRSTPAYNEGGILVLDDNSARGQEIVHLGVFPSYNCGNMLTHVGRGRPQFPRGNGWDYDPYLQIERTGDTFHIRTSADGSSWTEMPGSPIHAPHLKGKSLKVGLYHTTYSNNRSWVSFDDFNLWKR
ncbi:MAG: family 43 glycosylhydrolase [Bacteroidaceae bacterium]|nr:family 43 glycosylhydrolase [Bacteroidaceae bacterium]